MTLLQGEEAEVRERFEQFIRNYVDRRGEDTDLARLLQEYPTDSKSLYIDYDELYRFDTTLAENIFDAPGEYLPLAEEALQQHDVPVDVGLSDVTVRIDNIEAIPDARRSSVGGLRQARAGTLTPVEGQVTKVADSKGQWVEAAYVCARCGSMNRIPVADGTQTKPHECAGCERQGPFNIDESKSIGRDYQLVRLQEPPESAMGANAAQLDIVFAEDLVDEVQPGDRVTVLTELWAEEEENSDDGTFRLRGEANNVRHHQTDFRDIEIDAAEEERIKKIAADTPFDDLVASIKPSHHGDETIKLAIAFQLFGGSWKETPDGDLIRGAIHLIAVGDPGADKTGLLEFAERIAPRGVFTSGKNATGAGLTAAAVQDDFGDGGWTLEGGALVKADGGLCAIDEFDKVEESQLEGIHEALSRGTISPSKAGISNVRLPARATVLAAANPKYGRFDPYESIGEQIDIEPALFSRFDLIFTIQDQPDAENDAKLADHVLDHQEASQEHAREGSTDSDDHESPIGEELLRKYIAYAREHIDPPVLSQEAKDRIKDFYISVRELGADEDSPVPITARKLDALVRLAEASARIRLSDTITESDADRAVELVRKSLNQVGVNHETGEFDADVVETGTSKAQADRMKALSEVIDTLEKEHEKGAPTETVVEAMVERGYPANKAEHAIESLMQGGDAYEPRDGYLRLT